jgi:hypothetical protein
MFNKKYIKITQYALESGYSWLETILLIGDKELEKLNDWTVGYYHCKQCDGWQSFSGKLPPVGQNPESKEMHNERNKFWREHAHGDGRIILFERDLA